MVLWCIIMSQSVTPKDWLAIFKVKITARTHMIKLWLFTLYFFNCWFLGNQTWSNDTSSEARVSYKKKRLLHSGSRSQWRVKMLMFVQMIAIKLFLFCFMLNHQTFCFQTWYCDSSLWVRVSCKKIDLLFSRSRSLRELIWSRYDNFYCIFWTADAFATKHGLSVHCHKPQCFTEKLDCCVQGQGHSKFQNINECLSIWYFLNRWTFYCQMWHGGYFIMNQIVFRKDWFAVFKVKVKVKDI